MISFRSILAQHKGSAFVSTGLPQCLITVFTPCITILSFLTIAIITTPSAVADAHQQRVLPIAISIDNYTIDSTEVPQGSVITVPITIATEGLSLGAITLAITYDSSVIAISECLLTTEFNGICNTNNEGQVLISGISATGEEGEFTFFDLLIEPLGEPNQSTELAVDVRLLADTTGQMITNYTVSNGSLTIADPAPINNIPTIENPGEQIGQVGDNVTLAIQAADLDSGDTLTFSAIGLPPGVSIITNTGQLTGTLAISQTYVVTATVDDGSGGSASTAFDWLVSASPSEPEEPTNSPPMLVSIDSQTNTAGDYVNLAVEAIELDEADVLTFNATGLPLGLEIDSATGLISGTLVITGTSSVSLTVTDGRASDAIAFTWTVLNPPAENPPVTEPPPDATINQVPEIENPGNQTSSVGVPITLVLSATDADTEDQLSFGAGGLPAGLVLLPATGIITGTAQTTGVYTVTVVARDTKGGADSVVFVWTVTQNGIAPAVLTPGSQTASSGEPVSIQIEAVDPNSGALSYSSDSLPSGLSINPTSGTIEGSVNILGVYDIVVMVTNETNQTTVVTFTLTVEEAATAPNLPGGIGTPAQVEGLYLPYMP